MKLTYLLLSLCSLMSIGPNRALAEEETEYVSPDVPIDVSLIPDDCLIGNISKTTLSSLGMPSTSELLDYNEVNSENSFDFMGFHYERTINSDGSTGKLTRSNLASDFPESVYIGPVHLSSDSGTNIPSGINYSAYENTKTAYVYSYTYLTNIYTFPNLENIIFVTPDVRLNKRLPDKLKNIYFNPNITFDNKYWASSSYYTPSYFTHPINIICSENDKLSALKLSNSILDNSSYSEETSYFPTFYYVSNEESYFENTANPTYYEYGGYYYAKCGGTHHILFPGKYLTKGLISFPAIGFSVYYYNIKFAEVEKIHLEELHFSISNAVHSILEEFSADKVYIYAPTSGFSGSDFYNYKEVFFYTISNYSTYTFSHPEYLADYDIKFHIPTHSETNTRYDKLKLIGDDKWDTYDPSEIHKVLEISDGEHVVTLDDNRFRYIDAVTKLKEISGGNNPENPGQPNTPIDTDNDANSDSADKTTKAVFTVIGALSGTILIYLIYKIIKKFIRWLKR